MTWRRHQLTAEQLAEIARTPPEQRKRSYYDGGNLVLSAQKYSGGPRSSGRLSWVFYFTWHRKDIAIGLGSARDVSLEQARELAAKGRAALAEAHRLDRIKSLRRRHGGIDGVIAGLVGESGGAP